MKNIPPCCGLWLPCALDAYFFCIGEPSGHAPGDTDSWALPGQLHEMAAVTWTSAVPSIGQRPGASCTTASGRVAQVQTESRRIGTRSILQIGQLPPLSSRISGCMGQVYEIGGSLSAAGAPPAGLALCG